MYKKMGGVAILEGNVLVGGVVNTRILYQSFHYRTKKNPSKVHPTQSLSCNPRKINLFGGGGGRGGGGG